MTCEQQEEVAALLLGGLPPAEALRVEEHVLGCADCAAVRRELAVVRTVLDDLDRSVLAGPAQAPPPPALVEAVTSARQRRSRREVRLTVLAAAAAFVVGVVPVGVWAATQRDGTSTVELAGTAAAPGAWATVRFLPRTDGTIVDVEAGDLPTSAGRYAVTVSRRDTVLAREEFAVDDDGWAQVVLATTLPVRRGDTVVVQRLGGPTVLTCDCTVS